VLAIRGAHGDQAGELRARNNLAIAYQHQGRYAESLRESDRTKAIAEKLGDMALLGILLKNSADTCQLMGDLEGALIRGSEAVRVLAESQDRHTEAMARAGLGETLRLLGATLADLGRTADARQSWLEALQLAESMSDARTAELRLLAWSGV